MDKHLLPNETFREWRNNNATIPAGILPYAQVDLIFSHKNVWANLQNANPSAIWYHLHDKKQWLPLVSENIEGNLELEDYKMRGEYMKGFLPFYEAKGLEPSLPQVQVTRLEEKILKEVETAIR